MKNQERKGSGWRFDEVDSDSSNIYFYKIIELNSSSYVQMPLRSSDKLIIEKDHN